MRRTTTWASVGLCLTIASGFTPAKVHGAEKKKASATKLDPALQGYLAANGLLNRGLYELAAGEYRDFLSQHGDHEKANVAHYGLGVCMFRLKRFADAVKELDPLRKRDGFVYAAEVGTMLGQAHLALKEYPVAAKAFARVARKHSDHELGDEAGAGLVEALYLDNAHEKAAGAAKRFVEKWEDSPLRERTEFFWGLSIMATHEYGDAAERFAAMLDKFPSGPFAPQGSLLLAQCYERDNSLENAARQYRRVIKRAEKKYLPDALFGLASLLQRQNEPKKAGPLLDRLLTEFADNTRAPLARLQRGRAWFDQGEFDKAFETFKEVKQAGGDLEDQGAYWAAKSQLRREKFVDAAKRFDDAIEEFPNSDLLAEMYYDRAIALVRAVDRDAAVDALSAFRARFSGHDLSASALHLLAVTEHQRRNYAESKGHCNAFLREFPSDELVPEVAFLSAENDFLAGSFEKSAQAFAGFLSNYADNAQKDKAAFRLGTALYRLKKFDEAEKVLASVVDGSDTADVYRSALLALGDIHFQRSEWKRAEQYLSDYLGDETDVPAADDALLKLALAFQRQDKTKQAIDTLDKLLDGFPQSPHRLQALFERGQVLVAMGNADDAQAAFDAVLKEGKDSRFAPYALKHLASLAMKRDDYDQTAKLFARAAGAAGESELQADAMFQSGQALMAAQEFPEAQVAFEQFLTAYPAHDRAAEAFARRAIALARQNKHEEAVKAIDFLESKPAATKKLKPALLATMRYEKAWSLRELGRSEEAARSYDALIDADDSVLNIHAMLELAGIHVNEKRYKEGAKLLHRLRDRIQNAAEDVPAQVKEQATYRLAVCEFELENYDEAAELFDEFVSEFPKSSLLASAGFYAGEAFFKLRRFEQATEHLTRVTKNFDADPVMGPSLLRLGESLTALQRWEDSENVFTKYMERFSGADRWFQARFGIGFAREHQKQFDEAISAYRDVVARHQGPTAARAQFQIGECLFAQKNYNKAASELLRVDILYAYPQWSAAALYEAGRCFDKLGKTVEARAHFKKVIDGHGDTRWAKMASQRLAELPGVGVPGR